MGGVKELYEMVFGGTKPYPRLAELRFVECPLPVVPERCKYNIVLGEQMGKVEVSEKDMIEDTGVLRTFSTGATRDTALDKLDYEGFFSPRVIKRFAEYMHECRKQTDGNLRDSDNWQKGIPKESYMKSMFRHFMDVWEAHRLDDGFVTSKEFEDALCGVMFNSMGYLHEHLKTAAANWDAVDYSGVEADEPDDIDQ